MLDLLSRRRAIPAVSAQSNLTLIDMAQGSKAMLMARLGAGLGAALAARLDARPGGGMPGVIARRSKLASSTLDLFVLCSEQVWIVQS